VGATEELSSLSREDIEDRIASLEEELEDVAMERSMTLGGTGVHLGAAEAERLRKEFERDEARIGQKLSALKEALEVGA
jgi:hypothetical protein